MAWRKSAEETLVLAGGRDEWLPKVQRTLETTGFKKVEASQTLFQAKGNYKSMTIFGDILVTLLPEGAGHTRIQMKATAHVDNIFALFRSPTRKLLERFKAGLG